MITTAASAAELHARESVVGWKESWQVSERIRGGWQTVEVAGKPCDVFEPPERGPFVLLFLHGVGMETLAGNLVWTGLLEENRLATVCPHGKRSWWTNRICAEFDPKLTAERHLIENVLPFIRD